MTKTVFQKVNKTQKYQAIIISPNTKGEAHEAQFLRLLRKELEKSQVFRGWGQNHGVVCTQVQRTFI